MSKSVTTRLREACRARGLVFRFGVDHPWRRGQSVTKVWGCAYERGGATIAAFVTAAGSRSARRSLLRAVELDDPPDIVVERRGRVVQWVDHDWVIVRFDDGGIDRLSWPALGYGSFPGDPVEILAISSDPDPIIRWGERRLPARPASTSIPDPSTAWPRQATVLAQDLAAERPWILEALPSRGPMRPGLVTIRPSRVDVPRADPPVLGRAGGGAWTVVGEHPTARYDWLWDARWATREPVVFGSAPLEATTVQLVSASGRHETTAVLDTPTGWPVKAFVILPEREAAVTLVAFNAERELARVELTPSDRGTGGWWRPAACRAAP